ncbi:cyclase dehydrase [Microvirga thermotolerans]|uniref:Cyclase dehydrase n=1 Tax=Microvirga thermotolerans TaxID=2651334 RepID=A0A5P9JS32_9HYPH|nr:cyclase dehydrase [Microvirga thermotolerans]QFU15582.1 cyclase dehydrase [Microvirga thermotolerans]
MAHRHRTRSHARPPASAEALARGLGWFSLALGAAELLGARSMARWLGMERHESLIRAYGVREIATGIGILAQKDPAPWIWGRVAGDALDLATLSGALRDPKAHRDRVAVAFGAVMGATVLDVACANALSGQEPPRHRRAVDYSDRSGLPRPPGQMRGAARDFEVPRDMRIPDALRPYRQPRRQERPQPSM